MKNKLFLKAILVVTCGVITASCGDETQETSTQNSVVHPLRGDWVVSHGMNSDEYQENFNNFVNRGYRPHNISGFSRDGKPRFNVVWDQSNLGRWVARHGMTSSKYAEEFKRLTDQGYRLRQISGYSSGKSSRFAALWVRGSGRAYVTHHNMTEADYERRLDQYARDYRLTNVSAYSVDGRTRFAAIWEKGSGPEIQQYHDLTRGEANRIIENGRRRGFSVKDISGYKFSLGSGYSQNRFAVILEQNDRIQDVYLGVHEGSFQRLLDRKRRSGEKLVHLVGYPTSLDGVPGNVKQASYAAVFE